MKKIIAIFVTAFMMVQPFAVYSHGATLVENPRDIVIAQPGLTFATGSGNVSILGASDWEYPLYMNGVKVETTEHGFFAEYVSLTPGANNFVFTNNDKTKNVTITYTPPKPGTGTGGTTPEPFDPARYLYLSGSTPIYGIVKVNNGTRAQDNLESSNVMAPIAKGTTAQIIGEDKFFYMLADYSFVYKSGMDVYEGKINQNYVTQIHVEDSTENRAAEVFFKMNVNALYNYTFDGNRLLLTLYGTQHLAPIQLNDNRMISKISPVTTSVPGACAYEISLDKGTLSNGVYLEFREGNLVVGFKKIPQVSSGSLAGVKIFLDAGHGGSDPGAMGPMKTFGPTEKDINAEIAAYTARYLRAKGASLVTSREGDTAISLADRVGMIVEHKPDLSLSIHSNSIAVTSNYDLAKGYRTYYTYALPVTGEEDAVSFISRRTAELTGLNYAGKNRSNLALSRTQYSPAMIFEVGFMSNPEDYEWLLKQDNQQAVGEAIGQATLEWFEKLNAMGAYDQAAIKVFVNGEKVAFDVEPFIESGRTLVPIRRIFEAMGAEVTWNEAEQTATVVKGDQTIRFKINDNRYYVNGTENIMDVTARIMEGGRTVVPLRVLSEALGYTVEWDGATQTIQIK